MELRLDNDQTALLRDVLDSTWRDLRYEIADTDNPAFKRQLRQREQILRSIVDLLTQETAQRS